MKHISILTTFLFLGIVSLYGQKNIPLDTVRWDIQARGYILEPYKGSDAIYLHSGSMTLKDANFLNGTIEYDIYLKKDRGFPGVSFRVNDDNAELFYIRPHQSGNPDANQTIPIVNGLTAWQLYFGTKYSFPYEYSHDRWTHVKIVVNGDRAQVFLDHAEKPNLSWKLYHDPKAGGISFSGGGISGVHLANIRVNHETPQITDFEPKEREAIEGLIPEWELSDKFDEKLLGDIGDIDDLIAKRKWKHKVQMEEGVAANISSKVTLEDDSMNTVFAKVTITSDKAQTKLFEFGYSDRVVVLLNGNPIYKGTNRFRSRDYRYLGTIGLFDAVYVDLKKGKNTLLLSVSEDFGGWLVTGRFKDAKGLKIK
ncbi:MAG: hypothetical protein AAF969_08050 [Bacteroidota bacterium]